MQRSFRGFRAATRFAIALFVISGTAGALVGTTEVSARQLTDEQVDRYLEESLDDALATLDDQVGRWRERFSELTGGNIVSELIGYQPPTFLVNIADVSSYLYEHTGEQKAC